MAYSGLNGFITVLEQKNELARIAVFADPVLEIAEITDRIVKSGGRALLFENTGTSFPVLINAFGSDERMSAAIGTGSFEKFGSELEELFEGISNRKTLFDRITALPSLFKFAKMLPSYSRKKGSCQQVIHTDPDLSILPALKCWPHDGGRFITLPMVHTVHPETLQANVGMYRVQVLGKDTAAMHWQRHKTGARHYEAWKEAGKRMPVAIALGGDPVYTYSATAPLPENINEYILAGFLRKKQVKMVKCITNDLYVPTDADIVIEGYVDTSEDMITEGPFGDHTGFYSLADLYPVLHVTCITHARKAVYPATIVGIPPMEDAWLAKASEKIFLTPIRLTIQPEIVDFHMPEAGVAHNLLIVRIDKTYPGQGMKVINSIFGAGQMMFTKYLVVVSGDVNIRNYRELAANAFSNTDPGSDLIFTNGPLDVLDHSSDTFSYGGKLGIDATVKHAEERPARRKQEGHRPLPSLSELNTYFDMKMIRKYSLRLLNDDIPVLIISVESENDHDVIAKIKSHFGKNEISGMFRVILAVDSEVDPDDLPTVMWQMLGNTDPKRDNYFISAGSVFIDGTLKAYREGFTRRWPNPVCSSPETIAAVDSKWDSLGLGPVISSPSLKYSRLCRNGKDYIIKE